MKRVDIKGLHYLLFPILVVVLYEIAGSVTSGKFTVALLVSWLLLYLPTASLNIVWGYSGQLSLAYGAVTAIGAYTAAVMLRDGHSVYLAVTAGVVIATVGAFVIALLVGRIHGTHFTIATFAVGLLIVQIANSLHWLGGTTGIVIFDTHVGLPDSWVTDENRFDFIVIAAASVLVAFAIHNLTRSRFGRNLVAVRENRAYASSIGIRLSRQQLFASVLAGVVAGLGGALYTVHFTAIDPTAFTVSALAFNTVLALLLGGRGTYWGPILGSAIVTWLPIMLPYNGHVNRAILGVVFIVVALLFPNGIVGTALHFIHRKVTAKAVDGVAVVPEGSLAAIPARETPDGAGGVLAVRGLAKSFGPIRAVQPTQLEVSLDPPETIGIAGPNGAGKSTLLALVAGALRPDRGTLSIDGNDIASTESQRVRRGIVRVAQDSPTMPTQSVLDNVKTALADERRYGFLRALFRTPRVLRTEKELEGRSRRIVDDLGIGGWAQNHSTELSYGNRRLLSIAAALATAPRVLLLDEPSAGLSQASMNRISRHLKRIQAGGVSMVIVDHRLDFLDGLTKTIVMMGEGEVVSTGSLEDHLRDEYVAHAYLGQLSSAEAREVRDTAAVGDRADGTDAPPLLSVENVSIGYGDKEVLTDVTTAVPSGQIVAWLGPNGAGKTTLGACVAGLVPSLSGTIRLSGQHLDSRSVWGRSWDGLAFVPADRPVFPALSVHENLLAGVLAARNGGKVRTKAETNDRIAMAYEIFPALGKLHKRAAGALSGGQRQMVVTARALVGSARLVILDEPFAGLAPAVSDELGQALRRCVTELPMSVVLIDQDVARVSALVDRMLLLASGRVQLDDNSGNVLQRADLLEQFLGVGQVLEPPVATNLHDV